MTNLQSQKNTGIIVHLVPCDCDKLLPFQRTYICARHRQNLVKSMGRSLQVQIVNYLSILLLESSMDAQNNWFMHTIKVSVLQKFTVVVF